MGALLEREFLFVVGKGGVGKTTVSAAIALAAARQGKRVLIAMCNAKERLSYLLEVDPIGPYNQAVLPAIDAVNMRPAVALREYGQIVLRVKALTRAVFDNRFVSAFLRGAPGIEAWSMLGKAYFHAVERDEAGRKRYDLVIVDAPGTGHALEMLRVPRVIIEVAPPGLLRREAERAWELFTDARRSGMALVTLAEDMPVSETIELHAALVGELGLPVAALVVNGMLPRLFEGHLAPLAVALPGLLGASSPIASLAAAGRTRSLREQLQARCLARLARDIGGPVVQLPHLFAPEFRRPALDQLADAFV